MGEIIIKNYRSIGNKNIEISTPPINAELYFTFNLFKCENTSTNVKEEDRLTFQNPTYCRNSLSIIDAYSHPSFYKTLDYDNELISIEGIRRQPSNITFASAYISVGYTEEEISLSDTKAKSVKEIQRASVLISSRPDMYGRGFSIGNYGLPFSPEIGEINEVAVYADIYNSGNSGETSRYLYRHFKTIPFQLSPTKGCLSMDFNRYIKM